MRPLVVLLGTISSVLRTKIDISELDQIGLSTNHRFMMSDAIIGPKRCHQNQTVS